jgi:hypothetical protein
MVTPPDDELARPVEADEDPASVVAAVVSLVEEPEDDDVTPLEVETAVVGDAPVVGDVEEVDVDVEPAPPLPSAPW